MLFDRVFIRSAKGAAAYATVEATNTSQENNATTSHTCNLPASIASGELLLLFFCHNNDTSSVTTPSGWSVLIAETEATSDSNLSVFYKIATGSEGATVTVTVGSPGANSAHNSYRISGWMAAEAAASFVNTGGDTTPDPPSLTPSWGIDKTLWIALCGSNRDGATHTISAYPSSYTDGISAQGQIPTLNTSVRMSSARRENRVATEDPGTFTLGTNSGTKSMTIAIRGL